MKRGIKIETDKIINDYLNGLNIPQLINKYNSNSYQIIKLLKENNVYNPRSFSDEDILFLKEYYPKGDWAKILEKFPNCTKQSIHSIASKHKIKAENFLSNRWSQDELNILKEYYTIGELEKIQELLPNRSYKSITTKAKRLGLKSREYWTEEENILLSELYDNTKIDDILKYFPNRTRNAIILHAGSIGLRNVVKYSKDEEQFIIDNWKFLSDKELGEKLNGRSGHTMKYKRLQLGFTRVTDGISYSNLSDYVRRNNLAWKKKSMEKCGFKCQITGKRFDDIHHIHSVNLILKETLNNLKINPVYDMNDYSEEQLSSILKEFRRVQDLYPLGVCLCSEVHNEFHKKYGYGGNTEEQWNEFLEINKYRRIA